MGAGETYLKPYMRVGPKPLLGFSTAVQLASWDENDGNDDKKRLYIYINVGKDARSISYDELNIEVLDKAGGAIEIAARGAGKTTLENIHDDRCAFYTLQLKEKQKVETIKITWKDSVQTFLLRDAEIIRPSIES